MLQMPIYQAVIREVRLGYAQIAAHLSHQICTGT